MNLKEIINNEKIRQWVPHIIGVLVLFILPLLMWEEGDGNSVLRWKYHFYSQLMFLVFTFYINYTVLFPRFYNRDKKRRYLIIQVLCIATLMVLMQLWFDEIAQFTKQLRETISPSNDAKEASRHLFMHPRSFDNFFFLTLISALSTSLSIIQKKQREDKAMEQREKAHIDTELAFLRNQVSPHFFFNALNNIYALIAIDADKAQDSVEKLSELMRYLIYESDIKMVPIQKEIDFARNYIALMRQRLSSKVDIEVNIEDPKTNTEIPPLLFIPFIENVFKHGVSYREQSKILISISLDDKYLSMTCQNAIVRTDDTSLNNTGGLGIKNVEKRLRLLYKDDAKLQIKEQNNTFTVELKVPLNYTLEPTAP